MPDLREQLQHCFQGRVCLMGLGNVDYGDDGFGVRVAEELEDSAAASAHRLPQDSGAIPSAQGFEVSGLTLGTGPRGERPETPGVGANNSLSSSGPRLSVINASNAPERFIGRVAGEAFDHVIFLDAVDFGGAPGSVVLLNSDEMAARFPQISTHKISLGLLARQIEANGQSKVWLLGVQPESLRQGEQLSPSVQATFELLLGLLREISTEVTA